ncbi:OB-fold nucleic acid binding domain-containing protein [Halosegnis longus]|uniref:OB-fold nucleic acid binding domain-containing protein n=1 Tax=Halosegnis longus TaxID=2216012 RepID=UPI00129E356A|nr:OB-fold nucleic acid binding domain-containing protein [Halosegnis longus]
MGTCIVCGTSTDGPICDTHQEDVLFDFRGDSANQLTEGRFYRGVVDGYADFGVFVDLSPRVTGLLHRSKLDKRLESLDWEPGDAVCVQVTNVRDNGDVDLGWSIRQTDREFRGTLVDEPEGDRLKNEDDEEEADSGNASEATEPAETHQESRVATDADAEVAADPDDVSETPDAADEAEPEPEPETEPESEPVAEPADAESDSEPVTADAETDEATEPAEPAEPNDGGAVQVEATTEADQESDDEYARVAVDALREHVGADVRLEGEVVSVRQTSGPTVFELGDESGVVDCAAFVEAGVRAYPDIETGDIVRLDGEVRVRRDELQVETEGLVELEGEEKATVESRMQEALDAEASPDAFEPLADDETVVAATDDIESVATAIRRAVFASRPVVVRHAATTDGYVAGAAIERAVLPLVREEHASSDAAYHYFDRRPLEEGSYGMADATKDTSRMLDNKERHDEKLPLFVFAAAGSTEDSLDGLEMLDIYGVESVVVDSLATADRADELATATATVTDRTAGTVAANVAAAVNDDVRADLGHLPAVTFWEETPEAYADLAAEAGIDAEAARQLREAIALEAFYQSYEDKRELIIDLLFDQEVGLAANVSEQFTEKLDAELTTAEENIETRTVGDTEVSVLDMEAYTHRYDFPPKFLLLDTLHRRHRDDTPVVVGYGKDELYVRTTEDIDLTEVAEEAAETVGDAGIDVTALRVGKLSFLSGRREDSVDAVLDAVVDQL